MGLDPQVRALLDELEALGNPELDQLTPGEARELANAGAPLWSGGGAQDVAATDREVPGPAGSIPVRLYTPPRGDGVRAATVYYHGGGFVIGNLETHDAICRDLASDSAALIVAVDYRLAPEHRFPAAVEDCFAALEWVHAQADALGIDRDRVAVAGDSAGGTLAAVTALLSRDRQGPPVRFQLLVYPGVGVTEDQPSVRDNAEGYLLTRRDIEWFMAQYLGPAGDPSHPWVDPIHGDLAGVAPAHVMTAAFDPLRDGGAAYARRLRSFGVRVTERCYEGQIHGCFGMQAVVDASRPMIRDAAEILRAELAPELRPVAAD